MHPPPSHLLSSLLSLDARHLENLNSPQTILESECIAPVTQSIEKVQNLYDILILGNSTQTLGILEVVGGGRVRMCCTCHTKYRKSIESLRHSYFSKFHENHKNSGGRREQQIEKSKTTYATTNAYGYATKRTYAMSTTNDGMSTTKISLSWSWWKSVRTLFFPKYIPSQRIIMDSLLPFSRNHLAFVS